MRNIEQGQNIFSISKQIGQASVESTLDVYDHLLKKVHAEQTQKLDAILGFAEHSGSLSESVRRLLEEDPKINKKGAAVNCSP